jgi:hypothetical protein
MADHRVGIHATHKVLLHLTVVIKTLVATRIKAMVNAKVSRKLEAKAHQMLKVARHAAITRMHLGQVRIRNNLEIHKVAQKVRILKTCLKQHAIRLCHNQLYLRRRLVQVVINRTVKMQVARTLILATQTVAAVEGDRD